MFVRKEALLSSQIEGIRTTLEDVLDPQLGINANPDVGAVVGCIRATEYAVERLEALPISNRLLKGTHDVLMESVRRPGISPG